jgi:hypothetical protein
VTGLLVDLRERGLDVTRPMLVGLDGSKALRKAVVDVLDHPVIQHCQLHKIRNVKEHLPQRLRSTVGRRMTDAYHAGSALEAEATLLVLAMELDRTHPGAAASLREGLHDTLTVLRLGVPPTLARTLLGPPLPDPGIRETAGEHRQTPDPDPRRDRAQPVQRTHRLDQHQDPPDHPDRVRIQSPPRP